MPASRYVREEEVARCLEAVNHTALHHPFADTSPQLQGPSALLHHSRSMPTLPQRADSNRAAMDLEPADSMHSMDSGNMFGGTPRHGGLSTSPANVGGALSRLAGMSSAAVSTGEDDRLTGHPNHAVLCLATANGLLFSGGADSDIKVGWAAPGCRGFGVLWQASRNSRHCMLSETPGRCECLPPCRAADAAPCCLAQVWSLAGSKCVATLRGHRGPIRRLEIVGGHLVSGEQGTCGCWLGEGGGTVLLARDMAWLQLRSSALPCPLPQPEPSMCACGASQRASPAWRECRWVTAGG